MNLEIDVCFIVSTCVGASTPIKSERKKGAWVRLTQYTDWSLLTVNKRQSTCRISKSGSDEPDN